MNNPINTIFKIRIILDYVNKGAANNGNPLFLEIITNRQR
jgi:hypothetical protein